MHEFERWHRSKFGATPPFGACLRADHHARWLRLHSLPESKRYAEDDVERACVLRRAFAAASEVLPTGSSVWVVTYFFRNDTAQQLDEAPHLRFELVGQWAHEIFEEPLDVWVAPATWPHDGFAELIERVSQDWLRVAWFSWSTGEVFAPYDGGIDLIAQTPERAAALRKVFPQDWFSSLPSGL